MAWKLAQFYEVQQQFDLAKTFYLKILEQSPQNSNILGRLGLLEYRLDNISQSEMYYKEALRLSPELHQIRQQLIRLQLRHTEFSSAEPELLRYIQDNPDAEWGYAQLGLLKLLQNQEKEALSILHKGLAANPQSAWMHEIMGLAHEKLGQWHPALSEFKIALKQSPHSPFLLAHEGFVLAHLSQSQEARHSLRKALLLAGIEPWSWYQYLFLQAIEFQQTWFGPELPQIRPLLQEMLLLQNEEALAALSAAPVAPPTRALLTSVVQLLMGQQQAALETVKPLALQNLQPWEIFQIGYLYEINADFQQAEQYYQRLLQSLPQFPWNHINLGRVYEKQRRFPESIQHYSEFVRHFDTPKWALSRLALHLGTAKRHQEAIAIYQKLLTINAQDAESLNNLAWLYLTTGTLQTRNVEQALTYAQQAVALLSSQEHLDTLAEAYFQSGQIDLAIQTIKKAILKANSQSEQFQYLMRQYRRFRKGDLHSLPEEHVLNISQ